MRANMGLPGLHLNDLLQRASGLRAQEAAEFQKAKELELLLLSSQPRSTEATAGVQPEGSSPDHTGHAAGCQGPGPGEGDEPPPRPEKRPGYFISSSRVKRLLIEQQKEQPLSVRLLQDSSSSRNKANRAKSATPTPTTSGEAPHVTTVKKEEPAATVAVPAPAAEAAAAVVHHPPPPAAAPVAAPAAAPAAAAAAPTAAAPVAPPAAAAQPAVKRKSGVPAARRPLLELPPQLLQQQQQRLLKQQQQRMLLQQALMPEPAAGAAMQGQQQQVWSLPGEEPQPPSVVLQHAPALTLDLPPTPMDTPPAHGDVATEDGAVPTLSPTMPVRASQRTVTISAARATRRHQLRLSLPCDSPSPGSPAGPPRALHFTPLDTATTPGKLFNNSPGGVLPLHGIPVLSAQQLADVAAQCCGSPQHLCMPFGGASPACAAAAGRAGGAHGLPTPGSGGVYAGFGSPLDALSGLPLGGSGARRGTGLGGGGPPLFTEAPLVSVPCSAAPTSTQAAAAAAGGGGAGGGPPPGSSAAAAAAARTSLSLPPLVLPSLDLDMGGWDSIPSVTWRALDLAGSDAELLASLSALTPTVTAPAGLPAAPGLPAAGEASGWLSGSVGADASVPPSNGGAAGVPSTAAAATLALPSMADPVAAAAACGLVVRGGAAGAGPSSAGLAGAGAAGATGMGVAAPVVATQPQQQHQPQAGSGDGGPVLGMIAMEEGNQRVSLGGESSCQTRAVTTPRAGELHEGHTHLSPLGVTSAPEAATAAATTAAAAATQPPSQQQQQQQVAPSVPMPAAGSGGAAAGGSSGGGGLMRLGPVPSGCMTKVSSLGGGRHRLTAQGWVTAQPPPDPAAPATQEGVVSGAAGQARGVKRKG